MITPEDIQKKEFGKTVRGYREEEVDQFLDDLTLDYEAVLKENEQLKLELSELQDKYKDQEESIYYTLQSAKQLMTDISTSAERRAEILLKNAQLDADNLTRQTRSSLAYLQEQEAVMKNRVFKLKSKIKNILEAELEDINTIELDLFNEEVPDTVDKLMSYSAEFDGFFNKEQNEDDLKKTLIVASAKTPAAAPEPQPEEAVCEAAEPAEPEAVAAEELEVAAEEAVPSEEPEVVAEEAAPVVETEAVAEETEEAEEIIRTAEDLIIPAAEEAAPENEFLNEIVFKLSDENDSEEL